MCSFRRNWFLSILVLGLGVVLAGCAQNRLGERTAKPASGPVQPITDQRPSAYKVGDPYQIGGTWYYPKADYTYRETGIASWYGPGFHGRATANGEVFDQNALTGAHRTLPMPSMVRVTNLDNGRSIKVRINDRGPFKNGRIIDLSRRAADLLGFRRIGTAKVRVEVVADESRALATAALSEEAAELAPDAAPIVPVAVKDLPGAGDAAAWATQPATPAASQTAWAVPRRSETLDRPPLLVPAPDGIVTTVPVRTSRIFVQAGSFTRIANAHKLRARLAGVGKAQIAQAVVNHQRYFRVRFGPMGSVEDADRLLALLLDNGHADARVVVD
ncbi:MAG: septal ring lytic transglycosylase RlpA family protein [Proteobacteria bacterium]|nr:septal ring lytic transglycosylase RlpA family protein [Pseudomonadota bacterium]